MNHFQTCKICDKKKHVSDFYIREDSGKRRTSCILCFKEARKESNKAYKKSNKYKKWKMEYDSKYHKTDRYKEYQKVYLAEYRSLDKNKRQQFANNLRKYWPGLSAQQAIEKYLDLSFVHNNKCAICEKQETRLNNGKIRNLSVDHCHKTGKVRGLLCCRCNITIGRFEDNQELLEKAFLYLKKSKE